MSLIADLFMPRASASGLKDPAMWLHEALGGPVSTSGVRVNSHSAHTLPAYHACLRNLSEDVAKLPLKVFRHLEPRGREADRDHPINRLRMNPNPTMGGVSFRETLTGWAAGWGGGFAEIVRNENGFPLELWPIHPSRNKLLLTDRSELMHEVRSDDGMSTRLIPDRDMLHIHGLTHNGHEGYSVLGLAAESLGLSIAAQRFGASFFGNNTAIGSVLEHPASLSDEAVKRLRSSYNTEYAGPENAGKMLILEEGMKHSSRGIPPEEAQFLETRIFQVPEICRWFRMPPHKVQHLAEATFSNIEHLSIEYVTDTLMPWLIRWEMEIERKLVREVERGTVFVKHVVQGLLRGDQTARSEYYSKQFQNGSMSPNDIRELEDLNPIPGGDTYYVPANMIPSEMAGSQGQNGGIGNTPGDGSRAMVLKGHTRIFGDIAARLLARETKAAPRAAAKYEGDGPGFNAWVEKFYREHRDIVVEHLTGPMLSMMEILKGEPLGSSASEVEASVVRFASGYVQESISALGDGGIGHVETVCLGWLETRAATVARTLVERAEQ